MAFRKDALNGLLVIDFNRMTFAEAKDKNDLGKLQYQPLSKKKDGYDFNGESVLFHQEAYTVQKVMFNGSPAKKLVM